MTTVKAAQQNKADVGMSLLSRSLHQFYKLAFEHYSRTLDEPFNFIRALAEAQPPVKSLVNSFRTIMTADMKALDVGRRKRTQENVRVFSKAVVPVLCSTTAVLISRDNYKLEARIQLQAMFECSVAASSTNNRGEEEHDEEKRLEVTYKSHVEQAFQSFLDTLTCEFDDGKGSRCVNGRPSHRKLNQHQNRKGTYFALGPFQSASAMLLEDQWQDEVKLALAALETAFDTTSAVQRQENTWILHLEALRKLFRDLQDVRLYHFSECAWCLRGGSEEMLPCRTECAIPARADLRNLIKRIIGHSQLVPASSTARKNGFDPHISILILPQQVGRRILALDATGVRGMITLRILAGLEELLGGKLPMSAFFDLIGGTGAGVCSPLPSVCGNRPPGASYHLWRLT